MSQPHDNWFTTPPTRTGLPLRRFRCEGCGYGASRRTEPTRCPMCGGASWAEDAWQPSAALLRDLDAALSPLKREAEELSLLPGVPLS
jgi:transposase-like protein